MHGVLDFLFFFWSGTQVILRMLAKSPEQGAQTTIYCAVAEELEGVTGKYFSDCKERELKKFAEDDEAAEKLWRISAQMVGI